jgi:predicted unusual protein kinase regulating ubiquinone biosynthesis (AarF/ABC1/UbiB family)
MSEQWPLSRLARSLPGRAGRRLRFTLRATGIETLARLLGVAVTAAFRHGFGWLADLAAGPARSARRREARLDRTLLQLISSFAALKGAFVKLGQFAAVRHDLVPHRTSVALGALRRSVPPLPFATIRETVESELHDRLERLFEEFDDEPLGAASIAQVHRARLPGGDPVAVKVQYPWMARSLRSDLAWVRLGLRVAARARAVQIPDRRRLVDEFERSLLEELDFEREGRVAAEIAENLEDDRQIMVPRIVHSHSTSRVLTMSYCDAVPIDDHRALARLGVSPRDVLKVVARAYAKQIFSDGLFHADPHPGNLFVVDEARAAKAPRILFVDFGLSKRLSPELRRNLREGLYALLKSDLDAFIERMDAMGMIAEGAEAGVREAVDTMFDRIRARGGGFGIPGSALLGLKDEAKELLRVTPGLQLPNDLLLYARTLTYLFALGQELDPEVDLFRLSAPYLLGFLAAKD